MPFATGGDPAQQQFMVEGVVSPGLNDQQQAKRRELWKWILLVALAILGFEWYVYNRRVGF